MAHLLDFTTGQAAMGYVEGSETPWHGLGFVIPKGTPIDQWQTICKMDYLVNKEYGYYNFNGELKQGEGFYLIRSDNGAQLGYSKGKKENDYHIHQIAELFETIKKLCDSNGFTVETIGAIDQGKKVWALASMPETFTIKGQDQVKRFVLITTSFDCTGSTIFMQTAIRTVCNNTLNLALRSLGEGDIQVKQRHDSKYNDSKIYTSLGISDAQWNNFIDVSQEMANVKVTDNQAKELIVQVIKDKKIETFSVEEQDKILRSAQFKNVFGLFKGEAKGSQFASANGTVWGLLNAVTEQIDHHAGRETNTRLKSAWYGQGAAKKTKAFELATQLLIAA